MVDSGLQQSAITRPASATSRPPRPCKRLGQHFLVDRHVVRNILKVAEVRPHDTVFEIGPGRGALTQALCERAAKVIAVELDRRLVHYLSAVRVNDRLALHHGDALDFPYETLPMGTVVIANLPYNVSTPLLFRLLRHRDRLHRLVLTLQDEVVTRIVAQPGSRDYGVLSVMSQSHADPRKAFTVPARCFRPVPAVDSAVVHLTSRSRRHPDERFDRTLIKIVRGAFAHRRKTVLNSYRDAGWDPPMIQRALEQTHVDPRRRAETITVQEFTALATAVSSHFASRATSCGTPDDSETETPPSVD